MKKKISKEKKKYEKPIVKSETYLERRALACEKVDETGDGWCTINGLTPALS